MPKILDPATLPEDLTALLAALIPLYQDRAAHVLALVVDARAGTPAVNRAGYTNGRTVHVTD